MAELPHEVRALLDAPNFVHLATVNRDGSPSSAAVWGILEGERIAFFTQRQTQKARNLERDPRVAISIVDHEDPYKTARLRGRVVETRTGQEAADTIDRISQGYIGEPFPFHTPNEVVFAIEVERTSFVELPFEHTPRS
ncbi:MAG: PPOX class F420-dependent oxidoreductase [Thermoleophilaceae bacterium]